MNVDLAKGVDRKNVFYGIKETLKHFGEIKKAFVVSDCRDAVRNLLMVNKIEVKDLEMGKAEVANKLGLGFECEVFGLRK